MFGKGCFRPVMEEEDAEEFNDLDMLWPPGFRRRLCCCQECMALYEEWGTPELVDPDDLARDTVTDSGRAANSGPVTETNEARGVQDDAGAGGIAMQISKASIKHSAGGEKSGARKSARAGEAGGEGGGGLERMELVNAETSKSAAGQNWKDMEGSALQNAGGVERGLASEMAAIDDEIALSLGLSPIKTRGADHGSSAGKNEAECEVDTEGSRETHSSIPGRSDASKLGRAGRSRGRRGGRNDRKPIPLGLQGLMHERVEQFLERVKSTPGRKVTGEDIAQLLKEVHEEITNGKRGEDSEQ